MARFGTAIAACSLPSTSGRPCGSAAPASALGRPVSRAWPRQATGAACQRLRRQAAARAAAGGDKPEWLRELEATADLDDTAARLLAGANGDPEVVQQRMREEEDAVYSRIMGTKYGGEDAPVDVSFRNPVDQFALWVWIELYRPPSGNDLELLQEVINSWFLLGRLGGFNSANLQVLYHQDESLGDLEYDQAEGAQLPATFHDIAPLEARAHWLRFWLDMGTADELALDVLINALSTLSREQLGIRSLVFGGQNPDWPTPAREEFLPEVTMDPMRGPTALGAEDDDEWSDEGGADDAFPFMR